MSEQRQIQTGETFERSLGSTTQQVSRQGNMLIFSTGGKETSRLDITQPGNEAAGFLSSQFRPVNGTKTPTGPAPTEIETREVMNLSGVDRNAATGIAAQMQSQTTAQRAQSITQMTANRVAKPAAQANVIGDNGEPINATLPVSANPAYVAKNASFAPPTAEQLADSNFWMKVPNPQQLDAYAKTYGISADNENVYLKRDGADIYIRKDVFDTTKSLAKAGEVVYEPVKQVGADNGEIPSELLSDAFRVPKTDADIADLIAQNETLQQGVIEALKDTQGMTVVKQELADIRQQIESVMLSAELGIQDITEEPIAMNFIIGQAKNVEQRANLKLRALQAQEGNLLQRLQIETDERLVNVEAAKMKLQFNSDNIGLAFEIQEKIAAQEDRLLSRTLSLRQDSRETLSTILSTFQGLDYDNLDSAAKARLGQLAEGSGIPIDVVIDGMRIIKDQVMQANIMQEANAQQIVDDGFGNKYVWDRVNNSFQLVGQNGTVDANSGTTVGNNERFSSNLGTGVVTGANGSPAWEYGLDVVLDGGTKANVQIPFDYEVISAGVDANPNGMQGFGNQVILKNLSTGQEVWFSHLGRIDVAAGRQYKAGTSIGMQGNTGTVMGGGGEALSAEQIASGRGTHLDITMPKPGGGFYSAQQVAQFMGISTGGVGGAGTAPRPSDPAVVKEQQKGVIQPLQPGEYDRTVKLYQQAGLSEADARTTVQELWEQRQVETLARTGLSDNQIWKLQAMGLLFATQEQQYSALYPKSVTTTPAGTDASSEMGYE